MKNNIELLSEELDSSSILILGGTGLFGKELLPKLVHYIDKNKIKTTIFITTRDIKKALNYIPELNRNYIKLFNVDFLNLDSLPSDINPSYILHMATTTAYETFNNFSQILKFQVLRNSSEAISKLISKGNVKRLLFVSSGIAYGISKNYEENEISNLDHFDNKNSLAFGKIFSEFYLNSICKINDTEFKVARCFSFISKYMPVDLHYAIGNFVRDAVLKKDILIRSDGKDVRSYQNVIDAVEWLSFLMIKDFKPTIVNVGSDKAISIINLARNIKYLLNSPSEIIVLNQPVPNDNSKRNYYVPSLKNANKLGLSESIDLDKSILLLSNYLRKFYAV